MKTTKIVTISNFKEFPSLPADYESRSWGRLHDALLSIQQDKQLPYHFEELYRACEGLCRHGFASTTYSNLYKDLQDLAENISLKFKGISLSDSEKWLQLVNQVWINYCEKLNLIRNIFIYLDRTYILKTPSLTSIWETGLEIYKQSIFSDSVIQKTVSCLLDFIERERNEEIIDRDLIKRVIKMMMILNVYKDSFEGPFFTASINYFSTTSRKYLQELSLNEYLIKVEMILKNEADRAVSYLNTSTKIELLAIAERELITNHIDSFFSQEDFENLFIKHQVEDLSRLYKLLSTVNQQDTLKKNFVKYIKKAGTALLANELKDIQAVVDIIDLKMAMDTVIENSFQNNELFQYALKDAFESFVKSKHAKLAEWIAKYLDSLLRGTKKEEDLESRIDRVLNIFRYIQGKDIFEAFYKKDLAKRLLLGRSYSLDVEKSVISKLKAECGPGFTSKLEGMFKDMDISKEIQAAFALAPKYSMDTARHLEMQASVLTAGYWPTYSNQPNLILPKSMTKTIESFTKFYTDKYSGRRLTWNHSLGHCIIKANFKNGPKELEVSEYQAIVLLYLSDSNITDGVSVKNIQKGTGLDDLELQRTLLSLLLNKQQVLLKTPDTKEIQKEDKISINEDFTYKLYRVHINTLQLKETPEEQSSTTEQVYQDRQFQIDAAIVRVMKAHKTLASTQLLSELFSILNFPATAHDLKKRIDSLIDREYIAQDKETPNVYNYLA